MWFDNHTFFVGDGMGNEVVVHNGDFYDAMPYPGSRPLISVVAEQAGRGIRWLGNSFADWQESAYGKPESPALAAVGGFNGHVIRTVTGAASGIVDYESTARAAVRDVEYSIQVGRERGARVGVARQIGLLQLAEAAYGTDIMTGEEVDPIDRIADGSGRLGSTSGTLALGFTSIRNLNFKYTLKAKSPSVLDVDTVLQPECVVVGEFGEGYSSIVVGNTEGLISRFDTTAFTRPNLASRSRTAHILIGESPTSGGHAFPGNKGKSIFPAEWTSGDIMEAVSDVATNPRSKLIRRTGSSGLYNNNGNPSRFTYEGYWGDVKIRVITEPAGEGIITGHPID